MSAMTKYGFKIRTRSGMVIENLTVLGRDRAQAEMKLQQVYHHSEVLECQELAPEAKGEGFDLESMIAIINKQEEDGRS
jgi:hypothetical protein